jgi:uncharacterized membrane protein YfhO
MGLNLPFHAVQTGDPLVIQLLSVLLNLQPRESAEYTQVPLYGYEANPAGYRFAYQLDEPQQIFVPIAYHDGMDVLIDGEQVESYSYERLLLFDAPAGRHTVEIPIKKPAVYSIGRLISVLALMVLVGGLFFYWRSRGVQTHE